MYLFIEEGLRGGILMINNRFSKANNPYVPDYDPTQENSYVMYFDANNLYGWAMSQSLPTGEFDWLTEQEIVDLDNTNVADDNEEGYILEVDLHYPSELHDLHNDYPLAPEKMKISPEMLSPYCKDLSECLNLRGGAVPKLVPNLRSLLNVLDPRYQLPSRRTIMRMLPDEYSKEAELVKKEIALVSHVALTSDLWTSRATESYMTITCHFLTETWDLKSLVLETFHFELSHTAENIADSLRKAAEKLNISEKIIAIAKSRYYKERQVDRKKRQAIRW